MSRRPASFTQADVARVIRAAQQTGAGEVAVRISVDGQKTIVIQPRPEVDNKVSPPQKRRIVL